MTIRQPAGWGAYRPMHSAQECLSKAAAMDLRSRAALTAFERDQCAELAEGWRAIAKTAAGQDDPAHG